MSTEVRDLTSTNEGQFKHLVMARLHGLASKLVGDNPHARFEVRTVASRTDDPAPRVALSQYGPDRGFLWLPRKKRLADVRLGSYIDSSNRLQVSSYSRELDDVLVKGFKELSEEVGASGVSLLAYDSQSYKR